MPIYIATVWTLNSLVEDFEGEAGIRCHVVRMEAESARMFEAEIRDRYLHDPDGMVDLGPIGLAREQE